MNAARLATVHVKGQTITLQATISFFIAVHLYWSCLKVVVNIVIIIIIKPSELLWRLRDHGRSFDRRWGSAGACSLADAASLAMLALVVMHADALTAASHAGVSLLLMHAYAAAAAWDTDVERTPMLTDLRPAAGLALATPATMLANLRATALLANRTLSSMLADAAASTLLA